MRHQSRNLVFFEKCSHVASYSSLNVSVLLHFHNSSSKIVSRWWLAFRLKDPLVSLLPCLQKRHRRSLQNLTKRTMMKTARERCETIKRSPRSWTTMQQCALRLVTMTKRSNRFREHWTSIRNKAMKAWSKFVLAENARMTGILIFRPTSGVRPREGYL